MKPEKDLGGAKSPATKLEPIECASLRVNRRYILV